MFSTIIFANSTLLNLFSGVDVAYIIPPYENLNILNNYKK